ncbi:MAG: carbon-nitrogen hydrolase family protein [Lentisphaeria bacterium]|jgi:predicted amidohydrolase
MKSVIISTIQFSPILAKSPEDIQTNFEKISDLLSMALRLDSELVVLPELCLTGCTFMSPEEATPVSESSNGWTFHAFREFAVAANTYVAYGFIEYLNGVLYNSAAVISPDGELIILSRKIHGIGCDLLWSTPGSSPPPIVDTDIGLLSAVVCRDLKDESPTDEDKPLFEGAKVGIVAGLTNWGRGFFPPPGWTKFAKKNECVLALANRWGEEITDGPYGKYISDFGQGGSAIVEPNGKVHIGGLKFSKDCVITARVEVPR